MRSAVTMLAAMLMVFASQIAAGPIESQISTITLTLPQSLEANSEQVFEATVDLPAHLPPSYSGRNTRVEWRLFAGLDMK